jgi:hypothetical protein
VVGVSPPAFAVAEFQYGNEFVLNNTGNDVLLESDSNADSVLSSLGVTASALSGPIMPDYQGGMIDSGLSYLCPPWTFNLGGFFGPGFDSLIIDNLVGSANFQSAVSLPFSGQTDSHAWFVGPAGTYRRGPEMIGSGMPGDDLLHGFAHMPTDGLNFSACETPGMEDYPDSNNIWAMTAGTSWQIRPGTRLSASYWYWGTSNPAPVGFSAKAANMGSLQHDMSSFIGHEIDFYIDQQLFDNLTLTFVASYLFAGDAFCSSSACNSGSNQVNPGNYASQAGTDVFKLGARLQWNF